MNSLALINEFLGQPPNASFHGYQIDHIIEFCHWFMAALFLGWSTFFIYVLIRFRKRRQPSADHLGVRSGISTHLEFSVVLQPLMTIESYMADSQTLLNEVTYWAEQFSSDPSGKS